MAIFNALLTLTLLASVSFTATSVMLTRYEDGGCVNDTANIDFDGATNVKAAENCTGNYSGIAMCDGKCVNLPVGSGRFTCAQNNKGTLFMYTGQKCMGRIQAFIFTLEAMADFEAGRCSNTTVAGKDLGVMAYFQLSATRVRLPNCTSKVEEEDEETTTTGPGQAQVDGAREVASVMSTVLVLAVVSGFFGQR
mmetsp:Transcript_8286/g.14288  ORF Transcript_8286/g.14288 Transcript_8286/m.14288 type:complete len:194 (-) Transcript_8286:230-811(-)